jgi:hypothetical protein
MHLYLVKSDKRKVRYFFRDETKATALYKELMENHDVADLQLKYLKTSDEWSVEQLLSHFDLSRAD